ncbi:restriction endonuclease subunit S [Paracidovorax oryzae]|uniref:restriction endonuclease subunit S n=1 Tax=Paracidovorax oryzae TaxID=862720 RepID=UPI00055437FD|nr:restriction endonuclease subunit S [Paracidovorax oryzae]
MLLSNMELLATAPGGVAKLRELILTLAVQGKLVPQDPADEPAGVLLQKIRAEKDRLIAEGKIKRDKPLAEIAEEEKPFELPAGWVWVRIPEVTHNLGQGEPTGAFNYIDVASVDNLKGCVASEIQVLEAADAPSRARKNVAPGTVIYSTIRPYLKNIAVVERDYSPRAIASTAFAVMHPHSGVLPKYLMHYLRSQPFSDYVNSKAVGIAYPAINDANFFQGLIALPPEAEQSRIVARVEALMRLCNALEAKGQLEATQHAQLVNTLLGTLTASTTPEELADNWQRVAQHFDLLLDRPEAIDALEQALLQLAVRGLLVPQDPTDEPASALLQKIRAEKDRLVATAQIKRDKPLPPITDEEKPFEVPVGWEWVRWANIAMKIGDIDHKMPSEAKDGVPYVSPRDFYGINEIDFDGAKKIAYSDYVELASKIRPEAGDLIYPRYGTIGVVRKVTTDREFLASYSCAVIKVLPGFIETDYQYLFSVSRCAKAQAASATNRTTQPNVGLKSIQEFLVPLPPLAEQSRIVTRVTALRRLCADLRQRLAERGALQARLAEALVQAVA